MRAISAPWNPKAAAASTSCTDTLNTTITNNTNTTYTTTNPHTSSTTTTTPTNEHALEEEDLGYRLRRFGVQTNDRRFTQYPICSMKDFVRCVWRRYNPRTWLVILLFVAPVARHTISGRGGTIEFGSILVRQGYCSSNLPYRSYNCQAHCGGTILVLPGTIIVLVTAGAPPIRRASHTIARLIAEVRWYDHSTGHSRVVAILHTTLNQATHPHLDPP